jgi:hypothetical protein
MSMRTTTFLWLALTLYLLLMAGLTLGIFRARSWASSVYWNEQAQSQWDEYRDDVAEQSERRAPVQRRIPRSVEPPALVLLRDHFGTCLTISLVLTSALYACFMFFLGGVILGPKSREGT